jgi:hypothetical protein
MAGMLNPFVCFGLGGLSIEEAIGIPASQFQQMYKRLALETHPDKAAPGEIESATNAFQTLQAAKECLCESDDRVAHYARHWLPTQREKASRERDAVLRAETKAERERLATGKEYDSQQRDECLPGKALMQGFLSQALRSNQRVPQRLKVGITEENRLTARKAADDLQLVRARPFKRPDIPRGASDEQKKCAHSELTLRVVTSRSKRKLQRVLGKVAADRKAVAAKDAKYKGPSEAAWRRRCHSWIRAGMFAERMKPILTARRLKRERKMLDNTDPDENDDDDYGVRGDWRRYRRHQQEREKFFIKPVAEPCRAKPNRTKQRQRYKHNKKTRAVRDAAAKVLQQGSPPLALEEGGHIERTAQDLTEPSNAKKQSRRGGKAAKRRRAATETPVVMTSWQSWPLEHFSQSQR